MNADIFKAYDIRGKVGTELTAEVAKNVGQALGVWLPKAGAVAVGRDMRPDSEELADAVIAGLRAAGREVWDIGEVSTDMIYFTVGKFHLAGGAMVTASHNPGAYNGIKLCREEARPIGIESGLAEIRDKVVASAFTPAETEGPLLRRDLREAWVEHVLGFVEVDTWPAYKVAVDAGNGMLGAIMPALEPHVPLKITPMYFELDGTFPNHPANPLDPAGLVDLQAKLREGKHDFGIAFDGDGDRAVLVDETGEPLSGTVMTAILARYFLQKQPGSTILYNVICGRAVRQSIEDHGGKGVRTKVGHSYIKADMRTHDAIFAGEHSSHFYFRDNYSADSGLIASMIAIQVLAESGKKLSELANEYRSKYVAIPETNFEVEDKSATIARIKELFADGEQDEQDGLTVNYDNAWFNVRASNTEPLLRLNAEATTQAELDTFVKKVTEVINH